MPTIHDLCHEFNITARTVRKYVHLGIIGRPTSRGGRGATYPPDSYRRIRAARALLHDTRVTLVDLSQRPNWWLPPHQTS